MQSPIAIFQDCAVPTHYMPFVFSNYDSVQTCTLKKDGNIVSIKLAEPNSKFPTISGGGLYDEYYLHEVHLHWNSEHVIDDIEYPLEVQLIHFGRKYGAFANALNYKDGLAAVSIFYEITKEQNPVFEAVIKSIPLLNQKITISTAEIPDPIQFDHFLPKELGKFYRYQGSLTSYNFNEVVTWTLFRKPSKISKSQLDALKSGCIYNGKPIESNFREIQCQNDRNVFVSKLENWSICSKKLAPKQQ